MGRFKIIFNFLLVVQACSLVSAIPYGYGNSGTSDSGLSTRDMLIIEAARRGGMDTDAVTELLLTKQPVVKVKVEPNGDTKTTTYSLDENGSISLKTSVRQTTPRRPQWPLPSSVPSDSAFPSMPIGGPMETQSGTVTRSYVDRDGNKVTQTYSVGTPKTSTRVGSEWIPSRGPVWMNSDFPMPSYGNNFPQGQSNYQKTVQTYIGPDGKKHVVESYSGSEPHATEPEFPSTNWPSFNRPQLQQPSFPQSDIGWKPVEGNPDVETNPEAEFPAPWNQPTIPYVPTIAQRPYFPKSTTPFPNLDDIFNNILNTTPLPTKPEILTTTPSQEIEAEAPLLPSQLPGLEDFLDPNIVDFFDVQENGSPILPAGRDPKQSNPAQKEPQTDTQKPPMQMPRPENVPATTPNPKPIEEKPKQSKEPNKKDPKPTPKSQPQPKPQPQPKSQPQQKPKPQENIPKLPTAATTTPLPDVNNNVDVKTTTPLPSLLDFLKLKNKDPPTPEKPVAIPIEELPVTSVVYNPYAQPQQQPNFPIMLQPEIINPYEPQATMSPLELYLAKVGLRESDLHANNGQYTQKIIGPDGQVLTATFVLSKPFKG